MTVKEAMKIAKQHVGSRSSITLKDSARLRPGILILVIEDVAPPFGDLIPGARTLRLFTFYGERFRGSSIIETELIKEES